jgi:hypothetical protein
MGNSCASAREKYEVKKQAAIEKYDKVKLSAKDTVYE